MRASAMLAAVLAATLAHAADPITPDDVGSPVRYGAAESVTSLRHLRFSGQPDAAGLRAAKDAGVGVVIDLQGPGESDFDERAAAEAVGLEYHSVPVPSGEPFSEEAFGEIEEIVAARGGEIVLVHCSTGNRAAAWLAAHLVEKHGLSKEDALAVAARAGLTKDSARAATEAYLERK